MDSTSLILQIIQPFIVPILTTIGSLVLFHYSQRYSLQKNRRDIISAILAKSYVKFSEGRSKSVLRIKNSVEPIKFTLQFAYFVYFLIKTYDFLQKINIPSSDYAVAYFVLILQYYTFSYLFTFFVFFGIFLGILYFFEMKIVRAQYYLLHVFLISLYPTISDLRWGGIFYLSFYLYLYITLFKLNINYLPFALVVLLIFYIFIFVSNTYPAIGRLISSIKSGSGKRILVNTESLIFNQAEDKPKIRVQVGSTLYEGKAKEIDRDLVIISVDKELKEHEIHIRWEAIQAFEVIEVKQNSAEKLYFM